MIKGTVNVSKVETVSVSKNLINMPTMSGWEFLDKFESLDKKIKNQFRIYIMSSSIDPSDRQKAGKNKNVEDYIEKPLSEEIVISILENNVP